MNFKTKILAASLAAATLSFVPAAETSSEKSSELDNRVEGAIDEEHFAKYGVQVVKTISKEEIAADLAKRQTGKDVADSQYKEPDYVFVVLKNMGWTALCADLASVYAVGSDSDNQDQLIATIAFAGEEQAVSDPAEINGPKMYSTFIHGESLSFTTIDLEEFNAPAQIAQVNEQVCITYAAVKEGQIIETG